MLSETLKTIEEAIDTITFPNSDEKDDAKYVISQVNHLYKIKGIAFWCFKNINFIYYTYKDLIFVFVRVSEQLLNGRNISWGLWIKREQGRKFWTFCDQMKLSLRGIGPWNFCPCSSGNIIHILNDCKFWYRWHLMARTWLFHILDLFFFSVKLYILSKFNLSNSDPSKFFIS